LHCHIVKIKAGYGLPKSRLLKPSDVLVSHGGFIEDLSSGMLRLVDRWTLKMEALSSSQISGTPSRHGVTSQKIWTTHSTTVTTTSLAIIEKNNKISAEHTLYSQPDTQATCNGLINKSIKKPVIQDREQGKAKTYPCLVYKF
jgi:hypothetical protein